MDYPAKVFDPSTVASGLNQASVKMVFGSKTGDVKSFPLTTINSNPLPMIWLKDVNALYKVQNDDTAFTALEATAFGDSVELLGHSAARANAAKVDMNRLLPVYFDPLRAKMFTADSLLYTKGYNLADVDRIGSHHMTDAVSRLAIRIKASLDFTYEQHLPTDAEGWDAQYAIWKRVADHFTVAQLTSYFSRDATVKVYDSAVDFIWPGSYVVKAIVTNSNDVDFVPTNVTWLVRPNKFDSSIVTGSSVDINVAANSTGTPVTVKSTGGLGFNVQVSRTNYTYAKDIGGTYTFVPLATAPTVALSPNYNYTSDTGVVLSEEFLKVVDASGLPLKLVKEINAYLLDKDSVARNAVSSEPDIGYWAQYVNTSMSSSVMPSNLPYDPVNDWSAWNAKSYMTDRCISHVGYVPSMRVDNHGDINVVEVLVDGFTDTDALTVPLFTCSRKGRVRGTDMTYQDISSWSFKSGVDMQAILADRKLNDPDFPAAVTDAQIAEVGNSDYLFVVVQGMTIDDCDWSKSSFVGKFLEGQALSVGNTYVTEDAAGEPVLWDTAKSMLVDDKVFVADGTATIILPIDTRVAPGTTYTAEIGIGGVVESSVPAGLTSVDLTGHLTLRTKKVTITASAALTADYVANPGNYAAWDLYQADSINPTIGIEMFEFRRANKLSNSLDALSDVTFEGLKPSSYIKGEAAYTKDGATIVTRPNLAIPGTGSFAELAITQAGFNNGGRSLLATIGSVGLVYLMPF